MKGKLHRSCLCCHIISRTLTVSMMKIIATPSDGAVYSSGSAYSFCMMVTSYGGIYVKIQF